MEIILLWILHCILKCYIATYIGCYTFLAYYTKFCCPSAFGNSARGRVTGVQAQLYKSISQFDSFSAYLEVAMPAECPRFLFVISKLSELEPALICPKSGIWNCENILNRVHTAGMLILFKSFLGSLHHHPGIFSIILFHAFVHALDTLNIPVHCSGTRILSKTWFAWTFCKLFFSWYANFTWSWFSEHKKIVTSLIMILLWAILCLKIGCNLFFVK